MQMEASTPYALSLEVERRYRDYLTTMFYFRDPALRRSFAAALESGGLSKGPYLEATPIFRQGATTGQLFQELLREEPEEALLRALHADRHLYAHQEQAIRHADRGANVVVATGTGSGKTEAFLYPVLLHLYREHLLGTLGPGVRALILYPMNALVNDQRERLGDIAGRLRAEGSTFEFTYGQYVGQTPESAADRYRNGRGALEQRELEGIAHIRDGRVVHGEMVLREEIRDAPPHILLTNYSMLEYLLLRPDDSPLFDGGRAESWAFFVLDEAHQYRGAQGMEMALLLRRLKQRLRAGGREGALRCIATSATLLGSDADDDAPRKHGAEFANALFGEPFDEDGIVVGERVPPPHPGAASLTPDEYRRLVRYEEGNELKRALDDMAKRPGIPPTTSPSQLLSSDLRVASLHRALEAGPRPFVEIAEELFPDTSPDERHQALADLVVLLLRTSDAAGSPLLRARYHFLLRSLEGAFITLRPEPAVFLERGAGGEAAFEVALCRECGQHYLVGVIRGERLSEAIRDPGHPEFRADFFRPLQVPEEKAEGTTLHVLCGECGLVGTEQHPPACGHESAILVEQLPAGRSSADQALRCTACGYSAADPVREVVYGSDGPHAVIATTLFSQLPAERSKILAFADGRQDAAFFAWFLEDTYRNILHRNLIHRSLMRLSAMEPDGASIDDAATVLREELRSAGLLGPSQSNLAALREAKLDLFREFLADQPRISLEGIGLAWWRSELPPDFRPPVRLREAPWNLSEQETDDLVQFLLSSMRQDYAVELPTEDASPIAWDDLALQRAQLSVVIGSPGGRRNVRSWEGSTGRRSQFSRQVLERRGMGAEEAKAEADVALRAVWGALVEADEKLPSRQRLLRSSASGHRLNPDWWRLRIVDASTRIYQCDTCNRLQYGSVGGVCTRHRCRGRVEPIDPGQLDDNHYRRLYEQSLPGALRVEEHTAQLDAHQAREFQRDFKSGAINILSCSTTFEVGVDLGDLDTVFLRNVPPEAFNYAQRVGRAGRRDNPGFAVVYCRRSPHDLYHFADPGPMLSGRTNAPRLNLRNPKIIGRHMIALALSQYFRAHPERFDHVAGLLGSFEDADAVRHFRAFLAGSRDAIETALKHVVPTPCTRPSAFWMTAGSRS